MSPSLDHIQISMPPGEEDAAGHPIAWDTALCDRKRFFTEDPFGNRLEFLSPTPSSC